MGDVGRRLGKPKKVSRIAWAVSVNMKEKKIKITLIKSKLLGEDATSQEAENTWLVSLHHLWAVHACSSVDHAHRGNSVGYVYRGLWDLTKSCFFMHFCWPGSVSRQFWNLPVLPAPFKASFLSSHFAQLFQDTVPLFYPWSPLLTSQSKKMTLITNDMYKVVSMTHP